MRGGPPRRRPEQRSESSRLMSACAHSVFGQRISGSRRATPTIDSTCGLVQQRAQHACADVPGRAYDDYSHRSRLPERGASNGAISPRTASRRAGAGSPPPSRHASRRPRPRARRGRSRRSSRRSSHARLLRGLDVPGRVADHHRLAAAGLLDARPSRGPARAWWPDVVARGPPVGQVARVEQVDVVLHLLRLRGAGEHDAVAALACRSTIRSRASFIGSTSGMSDM